MINIDFGYSPWYILLCLALAGGLSVWMYFNISLLPPMLRRFLTAFRFITLFFALFLLLEPLLTAITEEKYPPIVVFLHDDSESILANKDSSFIKKDLPPLLSKLQSDLEDKDIKAHHFRFSNDVEKISDADQLAHKGSGTEISNALESIAERYANQNLGAVVLVSDGISTSGKSPIYGVENLSVPVHTILIGDTTQPRDLLIESIVHNELSYLNTETPLQVNVRALGIESQAVEVKLMQKGKVLQAKTVLLTSAVKDAKAEFMLKLTEPGIQQYEVHITETDGEINYQNNHQLVFIKVLETKIKIGVFAGAPHPDIGALRKSLGKDPRFELIEFVRKSETEFYRNPSETPFANLDLFILHNFPSSVNDRNILNAMYEQVQQRRVPLFHIVGANTRLNIHPDQRNYMAAFADRVVNTSSDALMYMLPAYKNHSTYRFSEEAQFGNWIETAPPLLRNDSEWKPRAGAQVFGKAKIKGIALDYPIFCLQEQAGSKNITWIGENIWRYRMHNYLEQENFELFDEWMYNLLQWLTTKSDNRRFRVYPTKNLYTGSERVVFKGQVYDDSYKPIQGAELKLEITDNAGKKLDYYLTEPQPGVYSLELSNLEQGTYTYNASGIKNAVNLGQESGAFSVGRSAIEFVQLKADLNTMQQVAQRTNGTFVFARNIETLKDALLKQNSLKPIVDIKKSTRSLNRFILPIIILLVLLSIEWVVRKRYGLV